jgi:hypothetical protein
MEKRPAKEIPLIPFDAFREKARVILKNFKRESAILELQARQVWLREVRRNAGNRNTSVTLQK